MRYADVAISALAYELPEQELTTAAIEEALRPLYGKLGMRPGWLQTVTGIRARRLWGPDLSAADAAARAAEKAITEAGIPRDKVGACISTSVYKQYLEPSVACMVHSSLGLPPGCLNFDVGNACLGLLSGLTVVANMIAMGQIEHGIVVAGEGSREVTDATLRKLLRPDAGMATYRDNLATLTLGSAAVAVVLSKGDGPHRFLGGVVGAATEHARLCFGNLDGMTTDPTKLLTEGVALAQRTYQRFQAELPEHSPSEYALHQVGKANHESVTQALGLSLDKALAIYPDFGNIGAASVMLTLAKLADSGRINAGDEISLMGIGSGLNVAMMAVKW